MEEDSAAYKAKTKERGPQDREESIFFVRLTSGTSAAAEIKVRRRGVRVRCAFSCVADDEILLELEARESELHKKREQWKKLRIDKERQKAHRGQQKDKPRRSSSVSSVESSGRATKTPSSSAARKKPAAATTKSRKGGKK